jgi:nicotinamidase-related amidase
MMPSDPNSTALVIIDTQRAFFEAPTPLYQPDRLIETIRSLIDRARAANIPVIYVQHNATGHLGWMNNTPLKDIHPDIAPLEGDLVIQKWEPDIFAKPALQRELEDRGIHRLILAGCQSEHDIANSCRSGAALGYDITLVGDGHSTFDTETRTAQQIIAQVSDELSTIVTVKPAQEIRLP